MKKYIRKLFWGGFLMGIMIYFGIPFIAALMSGIIMALITQRRGLIHRY